MNSIKRSGCIILIHPVRFIFSSLLNHLPKKCIFYCSTIVLSYMCTEMAGNLDWNWFWIFSPDIILRL